MCSDGETDIGSCGNLRCCIPGDGECMNVPVPHDVQLLLCIGMYFFHKVMCDVDELKVVIFFRLCLHKWIQMGTMVFNS